MKKLTVTNLIRPSMMFEPIKQPNGGFHSFWCAVSFDIGLQAKDVVGKYKSLILEWSPNPSEKWKFSNATVMLHPDPNNNPNRYILTYDNASRII